MRYDVVVVGSINVDLVLTVPRHPLPGETLLGGSGAHFAGGKGANQAVAAARLGAVTAMVGAVGDDATAATAMAELRAADVDLAAVAVHPGPTGLAVVTLADDGENTIVVVAGANASVTAERVDAAAGTIGAAAVCVLQAEIPLDAVARAAEVAAAAGVRVVLNVAPACTLPLATLRLADPLVVNEHELAIVLTAVDHGVDLAPLAGDAPLTGDPDALLVAVLTRAARLHALGVPSVLVTLGAAGVVGVEAGGSWSEPARTVTPRDTTGAGDAFVGALATHLARRTTLRDAAVIATRVAAYSVQRLGAQASYPWKDDPLP